MSVCGLSLRDAWLGDLTTLRTLQLLCRYTNAEAAALCGVSVETYRRWRTDRRPTLAAVRLLSVMAGYVPWRGWSGWEVHFDGLYPPISGGPFQSPQFCLRRAVSAWPSPGRGIF